MKNATTILTAVGFFIGIIGLIESVATFSLFQTFFCAAIIWGALSFYQNANQESIDDEQAE